MERICSSRGKFFFFNSRFIFGFFSSFVEVSRPRMLLKAMPFKKGGKNMEVYPYTVTVSHVNKSNKRCLFLIQSKRIGNEQELIHSDPYPALKTKWERSIYYSNEDLHHLTFPIDLMQNRHIFPD